MNLTNFTGIMEIGINDPNCSFFVGSFLGQFVGIKLFLYAVIFFFVAKAVDKLAIEPLITLIRKKLFKRKG